jgi:membrane protein DedA with SNARE-associated domain
VNDLINNLLTAIHQVNWLLRDLIAAFAIMCETSLFVGLIIPGDTIVLVAATGVQNIFDFFGLLGFVVLGSLIGESVGFWIGRAFGPRIRASKLGQRIGETNWMVADEFVETRGGWAIAVSRFLPVLHSLVPVTAGMTRMRYRTFIRWTVGACAVWAAAYVALGWWAHDTYDRYLSNLKSGGYIFAGLVVVILVLVSLGKKRLEGTAERMIAQAEAAEQLNETGGSSNQSESND